MRKNTLAARRRCGTRNMGALCCALALCVGLVHAETSRPEEAHAPDAAKEEAVDLTPTRATPLVPGAPDIFHEDTLDLATAQRVALRDNPSLKAGLQRVEQARMRMRQARAAFFPVIDTQLTGTRTRLDKESFEQQQQVSVLLDSQTSSALEQQQLLDQLSQLPGLSSTAEVVRLFTDVFTVTPGVDREFSDWRLSFSLRWQLFDGLAREFTYAASRHGVRESEAALAEAKRLLLNAVAGSYYAALLARENIRVSEADEAFNRRLLEDAKLRYEAGAAAYSDTLNFEVRANISKAQVLAAKQNYALSVIQLGELMGLPGGRLPREVELASLEEAQPHELEPPELKQRMTYALSHRPDLIQRDWAVERGDATAKAWRGRMMPSLGLSATETATVPHSPKFTRDDFTAAVSLGLSFTIFAGGRNHARWKEARFAASEAAYDYHAQELAVRADVHSAFEELVLAQEQLILQRKNAKLVEENRDLVEKAYVVGRISLTRLNEAQRDLLSARVQFALARVSLRQAWYNLQTATAETLAPHQGEPLRQPKEE